MFGNDMLVIEGSHSAVSDFLVVGGKIGTPLVVSPITPDARRLLIANVKGFTDQSTCVTMTLEDTMQALFDLIDSAGLSTLMMC